MTGMPAPSGAASAAAGADAPGAYRPAPRTSRPLAFALGLLACLVALLLFSPNLGRWSCFDFQVAKTLPETARARFHEQQLADPWHTPTNDVSRAVAWRLLPVLPLHWLGAPFAVMAALGWAGVPALVFYAIRRGPARAGPWQILGLSLIVATSATALTSLGWLCYFDAWWVLGLCVVLLSPRASSRVVACLLGPFVDERFVIGLPLVLLARWTHPPDPQKPAEPWPVSLGPAAAVLPYLLLRLLTWQSTLNEGPASYVTGRHLATLGTAGVWLGLWQGLRLAWLPTLAGFFGGRTKDGRPGPALRAAALGLGALGTFLAACFLADDFSRNTGVLLPVVILLHHRAVAAARTAIAAAFVLAALANLTVPAWHQVCDRQDPIVPLWRTLSALKDARHNYVVLVGSYYGENYLAQKMPETALDFLREAHREAPKDIRVLKLCASASGLAALPAEASYYQNRLEQLAAARSPVPPPPPAP